jgi:ribulose 1,5-bisphosphate synthetase/thiazole synthase
VYIQEVKQRDETPAVDKRAKPSQQRNTSTQQPGKKIIDKNEKSGKPKKNTEEALSTLHNTKTVDLLIIGGGPASLGFIINALKTGRFPELIQNDGIAILDAGTSFGGGNLCNYGINSNTSANGFLKSIMRKEKKEGLSAAADKLKGASN